MITKPVKLSAKQQGTILRRLQQIVGPENATANPAIRYGYSGTSMVIPKALPDFVVRPRSMEDIQKILVLARKHKIPITPVGSGSQHAGCGEA